MIADLVRIAEQLSSISPGKPRQADLRRSISTAYYALFHALAKNGADILVGRVKARRDQLAWTTVYRGLNHATAKKICIAAERLGFSSPIQDCASAFVELQEARHNADYDPEFRTSRSEAKQLVDLAAAAIDRLANAPMLERQRFAVSLLILKR